jgi:hypothetical protein
MPRHQGIWNQQWAKCARCGFTTPIGQLQMQKGMLLDAKCLDALDVEYRAKDIAEKLADTQETTTEYEHVAEDPQAIQF